MITMKQFIDAEDIEQDIATAIAKALGEKTEFVNMRREKRYRLRKAAVAAIQAWKSSAHTTDEKTQIQAGLVTK